MKNTFAMIFPSGEDFERIGMARGWKTPYCIVVAGTSLLAWLKSCLRTWSVAADIGMLAASVVSMSISLLIVWSLLTLLLYLFLIFFNSPKRISYRKLFSLVSFCGMIFLIGEMANFILLRIPMLKIRSSVFPNRFPIGLDLFWVGGHPSLPLAIFMHSINPIVIWYCATLSLGLHKIAGVSKMNAGLVVASLWALGVGSVALITSVLGGTTIGIKIG